MKILAIPILSMFCVLFSALLIHAEEKMEELPSPEAAEAQPTPSSQVEKKAEKVNESSLYVRIGKNKGIVAVVNDFVENLLSDPKIQPFFATTANNPKRVRRFKKLLALQVCEATGGSCKYPGKDMKQAHKNMRIQENHFNILVEHFVEALIKNGVGKKEQGELLAALGPMKSDIVEPWPKANGKTSDKPSDK